MTSNLPVPELDRRQLALAVGVVIAAVLLYLYVNGELGTSTSASDAIDVSDDSAGESDVIDVNPGTADDPMRGDRELTGAMKDEGVIHDSGGEEDE